MYASVINVRESNFLDGMAKLQRYAEAQQKPGNHYMRVTMLMSEIAEYVLASYHEENIDIDILLTLDLDNMKNGRVYHIGDRNWDNYPHASHTGCLISPYANYLLIIRRQ
jgi:hypothetical protein